MKLTPEQSPVERSVMAPDSVANVSLGPSVASLVPGTPRSHGPSRGAGPGPGRFPAPGRTAPGRPRALSQGSASLEQEVTSRIYARGRSCPAIPRKGEVGIQVEERASKLPWMGRHPPLHQGGAIKTGKVLPSSTIQTD